MPTRRGPFPAKNRFILHSVSRILRRLVPNQGGFFFYPVHLFIKCIKVQTLECIKVQTYSDRSEWTGLARAALTAWKLTVSRATARAPRPASNSVPGRTVTR